MNDVSQAPRIATWRDYVALTKPKVVSLLLFTAVFAMVIADRGLPHWIPLLGVLVGGYLSTGSAGVFNMILDRDIDARMRRTAQRPLVTKIISVRQALVFGLAFGLGSFVVLLLTTNLTTAVLAWIGLLFYVFVYTLWLKRTTWHNIVIGGAAGAVLPLLGWAAVADRLDPLAWMLFVLIFVWTPVHFWALAFLVKDQYAAVDIPMAPSVLGTRGTMRQMILYAILTALASTAPYFMGEVSAVYLAVSLGLNVLLVTKLFQFCRRVGPDEEVSRPNALSVYKYSMLYLALVFLALAVDRMLPWTWTF